jgi:hypothetical protein
MVNGWLRNSHPLYVFPLSLAPGEVIKALSFTQEWAEIVASGESLRSKPVNPKPLPKSNPKNDLETLGMCLIHRPFCAFLTFLTAPRAYPISFFSRSYQSRQPDTDFW